jgi:hypothetical protein
MVYDLFPPWLNLPGSNIELGNEELTTWRGLRGTSFPDLFASIVSLDSVQGSYAFTP